MKIPAEKYEYSKQVLTEKLKNLLITKQFRQ